MRSLADDLRSRTDEQLAALVAARPDLLHPVPADITALAQRAGSPASVAACLRGYDQFALHVVLAAAMGPDPVRPTALAFELGGALPGDRTAVDRVRAVVRRMRSEALLWGSDRSLHLVGPARDLMVPADRGPRVAALDPVVAGYARDPESLRALLAFAPAGATGRPGAAAGRTGDRHGRRRPSPARPRPAARSTGCWPTTCWCPSVGTERSCPPRSSRSCARPGPQDPARTVIDLAAPAPARPAPDPTRVDPGAVGAVLDVLHRTGDLGRAWAAAPPSRLRTGGIPARDLTRTARAVGATEDATALLIEVVAAAGLVAADSHDQVSILPTPAFDAWLSQPPARAACRPAGRLAGDAAGGGECRPAPDVARARGAHAARPAPRRAPGAGLGRGRVGGRRGRRRPRLVGAAPARRDPGRAGPRRARPGPRARRGRGRDADQRGTRPAGRGRFAGRRPRASRCRDRSTS